MTPQEQTAAFQRDIESVIDRYTKEFDLTAATAVGTLEIIKLNLWHQSLEEIE